MFNTDEEAKGQRGHVLDQGPSQRDSSHTRVGIGQCPSCYTQTMSEINLEAHLLSNGNPTRSRAGSNSHHLFPDTSSAPRTTKNKSHPPLEPWVQVPEWSRLHLLGSVDPIIPWVPGTPSGLLYSKKSENCLWRCLFILWTWIYHFNLLIYLSNGITWGL